jgi:hypothetical protein
MTNFTLSKNRFAHLARVAAKPQVAKPRPSPGAETDAARQARRAAEYAELQAALNEATSPSSPFTHLAPEPEASVTARRIVEAAATARSGGQAPAAPTGLAADILKAAAVRDAGGHAVSKPPAGSLAAQIIAAGEKSRKR